MKVRQEVFSPGDRVCHRVGGPDLIVISMFNKGDKPKCHCRFWDSTAKCFRHEEFYPFELKVYVPDEPEQESKKE